jgi:hypothetical protein
VANLLPQWLLILFPSDWGQFVAMDHQFSSKRMRWEKNEGEDTASDGGVGLRETRRRAMLMRACRGKNGNIPIFFIST